jgi:hypothetical protein
MQRIIAVGVIVLALGGCTTSPQEMRTEGPLKSFTTSKPEQQVAECILYAWQNESLAGAHYNVSLQPRPSGGKSVVSANNREMADVIGSKESTKVQFFSSSSMSWISDRRVASLKPCL